VTLETTRWSIVIAAGGDDSAAARALSALCDAYWYPLYAYVRQRGVPAEDARDLTQAFLTSLIERQDLKHVSQEQGRFRSFLLASLRHFLANDAARQRTAQMTQPASVGSPYEQLSRGSHARTATATGYLQRHWKMQLLRRPPRYDRDDFR
jgi:RNA polymerase sigma-70 factor (ECF subfamily)